MRHKDNPQQYPNRLQKHLNRKGFTHQSFARQINCSRKLIQRTCAGEVNNSRTSIDKILTGINEPYETIFPHLAEAPKAPLHEKIVKVGMQAIIMLWITFASVYILADYQKKMQPQPPDTFVKVQVNGTVHYGKWNGKAYVIELPKDYYATQIFKTQ